MAVRLKQQYQQQQQQASEPQVTYTPDGQPRQPGYFNPSNPYDTGRHGEQNREKNQGQGGKLNGWDYEKGAPMPGATLDENGFWVLGGGGNTGGGDMLTSSPYYQQVLAATNAAATADAAARRSAIQQALIGFGLVPENFTDKYGDIDALTRELAAKNTTSGLSTRARLLQARSDAIRQFSRGLSAKGLRRSGAKGYGLRRRQLEFDQGYSDALSKLLGYTGGLYSQFAGNEYQRQLALANALAYASQNLGDYGGPSSGGPVSNYIPGSASSYGKEGTGPGITQYLDYGMTGTAPAYTTSLSGSGTPPSLSRINRGFF